MKTKTIENGNTKVWFDHEEEFLIVNKNEPLIDSIIDANLLQRKYSKNLVEEVRNAGLNDIHGVFIELDETLQAYLDTLKVSELDMIFKSFNSIFQTNYKFHINSNGLPSIIFGQFDNYQEFIKNYFGTFLLKLFACKVDILLTEEENQALKGLTDFIAKFADDYLKKYLETSRTLKFPWVMNFD